jgi:hypothetical protein
VRLLAPKAVPAMRPSAYPLQAHFCHTFISESYAVCRSYLKWAHDVGAIITVWTLAELLPSAYVQDASNDTTVCHTGRVLTVDCITMSHTNKTRGRHVCHVFCDAASRR